MPIHNHDVCGSLRVWSHSLRLHFSFHPVSIILRPIFLGNWSHNYESCDNQLKSHSPRGCDPMCACPQHPLVLFLGRRNQNFYSRQGSGYSHEGCNYPWFSVGVTVATKATTAGLLSSIVGRRLLVVFTIDRGVILVTLTIQKSTYEDSATDVGIRVWNMHSFKAQNKYLYLSYIIW